MSAQIIHIIILFCWNKIIKIFNKLDSSHGLSILYAKSALPFLSYPLTSFSLPPSPSSFTSPFNPFLPPSLSFKLYTFILFFLMFEEKATSNSQKRLYKKTWVGSFVIFEDNMENQKLNIWSFLYICYEASFSL